MAFELAAIVGGTTASVLGTLWSAGTAVAGTTKAKDFAAGVCRRAAGRLPLPENHDLVIGIRTAHLAAIDRVARRHADLIETLPPGEVGSDEAPFAASVRDWLDRRLSPLRASRLDPAAVSQADVQQALDGMVHPASAGEFAEAAARNRCAAEAMALAEIERDAGRRAPPFFARLFAGEAEPGWYELVSLFVADQLKGDERFRAIFFAAELVDLKRLMAALDGRIAEALLRGVRRLARVEAKLDAVKQDTGVIMQMLDQLTVRRGASDAERLALQAEVQRLRAAEELSAQTIAGFFRTIGEQDVKPADAPVFLGRVAKRHRALLAEAERRTNLPAAMEADRARAKDAIADGDLDAAEAILRRLEARLAEPRREQQDAWQQSCRDEAAVKSERAAIAASRLRYRDAAALHAEAAVLVAFDVDAAWRHALASADALYNQGSEIGDNDALQQAIVWYTEAIASVPHERAPLDWATTQNNLGRALWTLGEREASTALLGEAVAAFRAALMERTRGQATLDWALTQIGLGNALAALGEHEAGTARLGEAVIAYQAALEEITLERAPHYWAATMGNIAAAEYALGDKTGDPVHYQAADAARVAMDERFRRAISASASDQMRLRAAIVSKRDPDL